MVNKCIAHVTTLGCFAILLLAIWYQVTAIIKYKNTHMCIDFRSHAIFSLFVDIYSSVIGYAYYLLLAINPEDIKIMVGQNWRSMFFF